MNVTAIDVLNSDEEKGTFTLRVMGNSSGKTFTKDVEYVGFAQKPNDYEMVSRAVAAWKTDVNYLKDFDFDTLYRLKDNSKFTAAYLQKLLICLLQALVAASITPLHQLTGQIQRLAMCVTLVVVHLVR